MESPSRTTWLMGPYLRTRADPGQPTRRPRRPQTQSPGPSPGAPAGVVLVGAREFFRRGRRRDETAFPCPAELAAAARAGRGGGVVAGPELPGGFPARRRALPDHPA